MEQKIRTTKLNTLTYRLHDFLLNNNHIGKENAINYVDLIKPLNLDYMKESSAKRRLRQARQEHNSKKSDFMKSILVCSKGLYLPLKMSTREETEREIRKSTWYFRKKALALLIEADEIEERGSLDGQQRFRFGKYMKEQMESAMAMEEAMEVLGNE